MQLSQKLLVLFLLLSGQRGQTIHSVDIKNIFIDSDNIKIIFSDLLKTSKQRKHLGGLHLSSFVPNKNLCIVHTLRYYLQQTEKIRNEGNPTVTKPFVTTQKPFKAVTRDTICRWTRNILQKSGIGLNIVKAHGTRAALTTAAFINRVPFSTILRTAGWQKDCTFGKFYNKPVVMDQSYSQSLLNAFD